MEQVDTRLEQYQEHPDRPIWAICQTQIVPNMAQRASFGLILQLLEPLDKFFHNFNLQKGPTCSVQMPFVVFQPCSTFSDPKKPP